MAAERLSFFERSDLILRSNLSPSERLFLLVVSAYGSSSGKCFPSRATLADDCGFSIATVDRCIQQLSKADVGIVRKRRQRERSGRIASNLYQVDWPRLREFQRPPRDDSHRQVVPEDGETGRLFEDGSVGESPSVKLSAGPALNLPCGKLMLAPPSICSQRPPQNEALPLIKDLTQRTHTAERQLDARSLAVETDAARLPSLVVCADLITDFYTRLFGSSFAPPNATPAEMTLASTIVRHCGDVDIAKALQATVVERIKRSFPACRRFLGAEAEWKLRLAANAKSRRDDDVRNAERARRRQETSAAEQRKAQADHDETLPAWQALPPEERERFLARYPAAVAGREFFAVLDFASSLESSPCR